MGNIQRDNTTKELSERKDDKEVDTEEDMKKRNKT
jgi:hypothetical protein